MGYFSNGTEGEMYRERYCDRCVHDNAGEGPMCAIWLMHLESCHGPDREQMAPVLHRLIPRSADGLDNERCVFFIHANGNLPFTDHA